MINVLINGCNGKMGQEIANLVHSSHSFCLIGGIAKQNSKPNFFNVFTHFSQIPQKPDVIIDFSHPSALDSIVDYAVRTGTPAVIATTGLSAEQTEKIHEASKKVPMFFTANMSLGVSLLTELAQKAARVLGNDFDIEIIERHHNQKIDAPSGTALMLADAISSQLEGDTKYEYDRHSKREKRSKNEIGIHAVRGGTIVGEHEIMFAGNDEIITLSHSARSKQIFAVGAVNAALFLKGKKPGLYTMKELVEAK